MSLPVVFLGIHSVGFLDPDEGMYGAIAREMAEGGIRYLEKPPLYYWLSALTMKLFGPSEGVPAFLAIVLRWHVLAALPPAERLRALVGFWAVVVVGFFALSGSKLEYYALPGFPALALMVGGRWGGAMSRTEGGSGLSRWLAVSAAGGLVVGLASLVGSGSLTPELVHAGLAELNVYYRILRDQRLPFPFPSAEPFAALLFWLGLTLLLGLPGAFALFSLKRPRASFATLVGLFGVVAGLVFQLLLVVEPHHSTKALAQAVSARAGERDLLAHEGSVEYSAGLPFYTGRRFHVVNGRRGDLDLGSRFPDVDGYFLDGPRLAAIWNGASRVFLVAPETTERSVLLSLASGRVHLLGQYGSRRLYSNRGD